MIRTRDLDRQYRRILFVAIGLSAAAHVGVLALRFTTAPLPSENTTTISFASALPDPEPMKEDRTQLIQFMPALAAAPAGPVSEASPAAPSAASASATPVSVSQTGMGATVPSAALAEVAYEKMPLVDPLSQGEVSPVIFTDLPVAAAFASELEEGEADVAVYVPGSIGKAKRNWAGNDGTNTVGNGRSTFVIVGGSGGHCPMPGRAPPIWKSRA